MRATKRRVPVWLMVALGLCLMMTLIGALSGGGRPSTNGTTNAANAPEGTAMVAGVRVAAGETVEPTATPRPTRTQAPTATPVPTTAPQVLKGKGQQVTDAFQLGGLAVFRMKYSGARNFIVTLLNDQGEMVELLANAIGAFSGSVATGVQPGAYVLNVESSGAWEIVVEQPVPGAQALQPPVKLTGKGAAASEFLSLPKGLVKFTLKHEGKRNFIVTLLDQDGQVVDLLVNVIGSHDGSTAVGIRRAGAYLLNVTADGAWTITAQ